MRTANVIFAGFMVIACLFGCGRKTVLDGKVVDGKGQPMAGIRVVANQVQGNDKMETTTGANGAFQFNKLYAASQYELIPYLDAKIKSRSLMTESAPAGQKKSLTQPIMILFVPSKDGLLVRDTGMEMMWVRDAGKMGKMNWDAAMKYAKQFNYAGFSDWRLPTMVELRSLAMYAGRSTAGGKTPADNLNQDVFTNVQPGCYWSSDINEGNKAFAWAVNMADGKKVNDNKNDFKYYVWLVRSGK